MCSNTRQPKVSNSRIGEQASARRLWSRAYPLYQDYIRELRIVMRKEWGFMLFRTSRRSSFRPNVNSQIL